MGHDVIETPNIDKLANESLTFTRGYVPGLRHRWVVQGDWKLIYPRYSDANLQDVEIELYNIMRDPNERHNLVDEHPRRKLSRACQRHSSNARGRTSSTST